MASDRPEDIDIVERLRTHANAPYEAPTLQRLLTDAAILIARLRDEKEQVWKHLEYERELSAAKHLKIAELEEQLIARLRSGSAPEGRRWRHKKRGTEYTEIARGLFHCAGLTHVEALDNAPVVIYRCDDGGQVWVRPTYEFEDGRFELLAARPSPPPVEVEDAKLIAALELGRQWAQCGLEYEASEAEASSDIAYIESVLAAIRSQP